MSRYLPHLESFFTKIKAPVFKLSVLSETIKLIPKVLKNSHIEKLTITGPCTFNLYPVMENLREIDLNFREATHHDEDSCSYFEKKCKDDDRKIHRQGLCILNLAAAYDNCPKLEKFMGLQMSGVMGELTFQKWNSRVKELLYAEYIKMGGELEMKQWCSTRWVSRKPIVPTVIGEQRRNANAPNIPGPDE